MGGTASTTGPPTGRLVCLIKKGRSEAAVQERVSEPAQWQKSLGAAQLLVLVLPDGFCPAPGRGQTKSDLELLEEHEHWSRSPRSQLTERSPCRAALSRHTTPLHKSLARSAALVCYIRFQTILYQTIDVHAKFSYF